MAKHLTQNFSILFFISILINFLGSTMQDEPCPYPCYPPPTGPGSGTSTPSPPVTLPPPSQAGSGSGSGSGSSSYPPPSGYYPTPTGNLPNYPSPPFGNNLFGPPPPNAILPYFPYYFRKPPLQTSDQSSATSTPARSTILITATSLLASVFLFITSCLS